MEGGAPGQISQRPVAGSGSAVGVLQLSVSASLALAYSMELAAQAFRDLLFVLLPLRCPRDTPPSLWL